MGLVQNLAPPSWADLDVLSRFVASRGSDDAAEPAPRTVHLDADRERCHGR